MLRLMSIVAVLAMSAAVANADVLWSHDFETPGGFTTSDGTASDGSNDYSLRTDGSDISGGVTFTNPDGYFFAAQDIDANDALGMSPATSTFSGIDVSGYENLAFAADWAEDDSSNGDEDWDKPDFVSVEYQIDGEAWTKIFALENDDSTFNSAPFVDDNLDGVGEGAEITDTFTTHGATISEIGSSLNLRFEFALDSGDEDIAVDNITVTGDVIPEPATMALLGLGGLVALRRRRG